MTDPITRRTPGEAHAYADGLDAGAGHALNYLSREHPKLAESDARTTSVIENAATHMAAISVAVRSTLPPAEASVVFRHGPVTITLDGLPASIDPRSVEITLSLHSSCYPDDIRAAFDRFADVWHALGGSGTFESPTEGDRYARSHAWTASGARSSMYLHPPQSRLVEGREALLSVSGVEGDAEGVSGPGVASGAVDAPCERTQP